MKSILNGTPSQAKILIRTSWLRTADESSLFFLVQGQYVFPMTNVCFAQLQMCFNCENGDLLIRFLLNFMFNERENIRGIKKSVSISTETSSDEKNII